MSHGQGHGINGISDRYSISDREFCIAALSVFQDVLKDVVFSSRPVVVLHSACVFGFYFWIMDDLI